MRIILVAVFAAFCMVGTAPMATAGTYQATGVYVGTPSPAVTRLFAAFPNGGDGLVAAIRDLLIADPSLADDVAFVASRANEAQKSAAAAGMAQAIIALNIYGNNAGVAQIASAGQLSGDPLIQTAVLTAVGGVNAPANLYAGTNSNPVVTQCNSVSPAGPTGCR
jgi:hypothetical protein